MQRDIFFFQAEDGIRDLVRSRGLGDVYKRQPVTVAVSVCVPPTAGAANVPVHVIDAPTANSVAGHDTDAVSYTHLTLPTSDLV